MLLQRCSTESSTGIPVGFWVGGLLFKAEYQEKGYPYYSGVTGEPRVQGIMTVVPLFHRPVHVFSVGVGTFKKSLSCHTVWG